MPALLVTAPCLTLSQMMNRSGTLWGSLAMLLVLPCAIALADAGDMPAAQGAEIDLATFVQNHGGPNWYSVSMQGQKAGYLRWQARIRSTDVGPALRVEEFTKVFFAIGNVRQQMSSRLVTDYDIRNRPERIVLTQDLMGRHSETHVIARAETLDITVTQPDGQHTRSIPLPENFGSDLDILLAAAGGRITADWRHEFAAFDPFSGHMDQYVVRVAEYPSADNGAGVLLLTDVQKAAVTIQTRLAADGSISEQSLPALMGIVVRRTTENEALAEITGPDFSTGIQVGRPPFDPHRVSAVSLIASAAADMSVIDMIPSTARQQVLARDDGTVEVVCTPQRVPSHTVQIPVTDPEFSVYLGHNEITQCDDERIAGLARQIVGDETDAWQASIALLNWVYGNLRKVQSDPRPVSALEVLEQKQGDCSEHAVLMAALAKSVGIPVRIAIGLVYVNGQYAYHEWNELYVGEWVEMDPSWGRLTVGAAHIKLAAGPADRDAMLTNNIAGGKTIGTLFLKFNAQQPEAAGN